MVHLRWLFKFGQFVVVNLATAKGTDGCTHWAAGRYWVALCVAGPFPAASNCAKTTRAADTSHPGAGGTPGGAANTCHRRLRAGGSTRFSHRNRLYPLLGYFYSFRSVCELRAVAVGPSVTPSQITRTT